MSPKIGPHRLADLQLSYQDGSLHFENVDLADLIVKAPTPVYVYSEKALSDRFQELEKNLTGIKHQVCFAVKANSNLQVLKCLHTLGSGFDVVSGGELFRVSKIGASARKIVFSGVGKSRTEIEEALAYQNGIYSINVEGGEECAQIEQIAKNLNVQARVGFRLNPDIKIQSHPYIATGLRDGKFGLDLQEIVDLAKRFAKSPSLKIVGLSCHIGSQILSLNPLEMSFKHLIRGAKDLEKILGTPVEFLDIGGGLGVTYEKEKPPSVQKYGALIRKYFGGSGYTIVLEPGKWLSANTGILVTQILYVKKRKIQQKQKKFWIVDASMSELIRPALYQSWHDIIPLQLPQNSKTEKIDVVGPICESADFLAKNRNLPVLKAGDFCALLSAGAYGMSMASRYNSRPLPAEVWVSGKNIKIIRERETYNDLVEKEVL